MQAFDLVIRGGLRIGQTCFERSDGFDLISLPLFHDVDLARPRWDTRCSAWSFSSVANNDPQCGAFGRGH
jgi:hypothetical protein